MGRIIGPPELAPKGKPIFFISGTFRGALDWTTDFAAVLKGEGYTIALNDFSERVKLHPKFGTKLEWGDYYIEKALAKGITLIWFAEQNSRRNSNKTHHFDSPYGANAMYELGRCLKHRYFFPYTRLMIGCDENYDRKNAVLERVKLAKVGVKPFVGNIADMCEKTLQLMRQ